MGLAASEVLSQSLAGAMDGPVIAPAAMRRLNATLGPRPAGAPGISADRTAAQLAGANHIITGYVERTAGGLRVTGTEMNIATGKAVRSVTVVDSSPLNALTGLAHTFSPRAGKFQTSGEAALRLYCAGREGPPEVVVASLEQALQADPQFGPAWEALIEFQVARGDRPAAEALLAKAREQHLDKLTVANLDLETAVLHGDLKGRLVALKQIAALSPGDTVLLRSLAESESAAGQFAESAADWRKLREVLSTDADVWNQLGYTLAWSGDYAGAVQAMEGYARLRPVDPNPPDSLGDVHYLYRKFKAAAAAYQQAYAKAPQFQAGGALYKSAWAKFKAGDQAGADADFAEFRKVRQAAGTFVLVSADWLYRTGRQKEAVAELRKALEPGASKDAEAAGKVVIYDQLAIWELLAGDRAAAAKDAEAAGAPSSPASVAVRFASLPSAPAAEWESRAMRLMPTPEATGLRQLALGYALLLDGRSGNKEAALRWWKVLSDGAPATDFALRAVYTKLKGEQPKFEVLPDPGSVSPFAAVQEKL